MKIIYPFDLVGALADFQLSRTRNRFFHFPKALTALLRSCFFCICLFTLLQCGPRPQRTILADAQCSHHWSPSIHGRWPPRRS
jgi:hypothetical protein